MGKHKHADVIKAWAEGAEVQVFRHEYDGYYWEDTATPSFNTDFEYRVKPADKIAEKEPIGFMDFGDPKNWKEFKNNSWGNSNRETDCAECGVTTSDGYALYCVKCSEPIREWVDLTGDEIAEAVGSQLDEVYLTDFRKVIAKLKEKNK